MATLVSPGVSVSVTDESFYATAGQGTVPLLLIATASNKYQSGSSTSLASGTLASNAGQLQIVTSQRDLLQKFGNPTFYSVAGSNQFDNELNESGLFAAYEYLGIANTACVLRADVDLSQLAPTATSPVGATKQGQYWLDSANTNFGIFRSNGQSNPAYAWSAETPITITSKVYLERFVAGASASTPIVDADTSFSVITGSASRPLVINGVVVPVYGPSASKPDTLNTVTSKINSNTTLNQSGISAVIFARTDALQGNTSTYAATVYNLRIISSDSTVDIDLTNSHTQVLTALNFLDATSAPTATPINYIFPAAAYGTSGNYAIDLISADPTDGIVRNKIFEKITTTTDIGTKAWWYVVGSIESNYPGFGWTPATPRVVTGKKGYGSTAVVITAGASVQIQIGSANPVTVTATGTTISNWVNSINVAMNNAGLNAVASTTQRGNLSYFSITNYDGTDIWLHSIVDINLAPQDIWATLGVVTNQNYFGSVTSTNSAPTFSTTHLLTSSAVPASLEQSGAGYNPGDSVQVPGGSPSSVGIVTNVQVTSATFATNEGNLQNGDIIEYGNGSTHFNSKVVMYFTHVGVGNTPTLYVDPSQNASVRPGDFSGANPATAITTTDSNVKVYRNGAIVSVAQVTIDLAWGVAAITFDPANATYGLGVVSGNYTTYPASPASTTAITGAGDNNLLLMLTSGNVSGDMFTIDPGTGPVTIYVPAGIPATPNTNVSGIADVINASTVGYLNSIAAGPIKAVANGKILTITNLNGTNFLLADVSGTPLNTMGIKTGWTFGRQLTYRGYQFDLQVPSQLAELAANNVWINTDAANRGANWAFKEYIGGVWTPLNTVPNTGVVPLYGPGDTAEVTVPNQIGQTADQIANMAFGAQRGVGSIYIRYNNDDDTLPEANFVIYKWYGTTWSPMSGSDAIDIYSASPTGPTGAPADGTYWYNTDLRVDMMVGTGQIWQAYGNIYPATDPNGVIIDGSAPLTQSNGNSLVDYDIWLDSSNISYPTMYRYTASTSTWTLIDNTDHSSPAGIIFGDSRWTADGTINGSQTAANMNRTVGQISPTVDSDAPNAELYPRGMLLFNTRYSSNNVKQWRKNYFPANAGQTVYPIDTWVTASGNKPDGSPYMGHQAQRIIIVEGINAQLASNQDIRSENVFFNLIAAPGYPEALPEMGLLNQDIKNVAFVIGDTPARLQPDGTSIQNWATDTANASYTGDSGLTYNGDPYTALYYPWGLATNLDGSFVLAPPSHMALRTYAYNDQVAYPWFPPAGFNRGIVIGMNSVGYLTANGTYQPVQLNQGQRDVMYVNKINPIAYIPNRGLVIYGQKTLDATSSARDRVNVSRLICYLNYQLDLLSKPYLFELNDIQTQKSVTATFTSFLGNLVSLRALYDFAVVCDPSNNTAARIDANELWIDIAVKPEKSIEFIYIPMRLLNTGAPLPGANRNG